MEAASEASLRALSPGDEAKTHGGWSPRILSFGAEGTRTKERTIPVEACAESSRDGGSIPPASTNSSPTEVPTKETTTPPAETAKPAKKTKEETAPKWSKEGLLKWLAEEASTDEIMARENTLTKGLKDLDQNGQIETVRAWNARRKAILADRETK